MRRLSALCLIVATAGLITACASDESAQTPIVDTALPALTAPAPGACDPDAERIPSPTIVIDGNRTDATYGIGQYECGTITGDGYIINSFNPVLLDAGGPVEVDINGTATATISWALGEPFTRDNNGVWTSNTPQVGCARLTILLTSATGSNTATFGADIRVGGEAIDCPQRVIDPSDPSDTTPAAKNTMPPPVVTTKTTTKTPTPTTTARTGQPATTQAPATTTAPTIPVTAAPTSAAPDPIPAPAVTDTATTSP
jgi:hypothetical protein